MASTVGCHGLVGSFGLGDYFLALKILYNSDKGSYPYDHNITSNVFHFFHNLTK